MTRDVIPIYDDVYFEALCFMDMQDGLPCSCGAHQLDFDPPLLPEGRFTTIVVPETPPSADRDY